MQKQVKNAREKIDPGWWPILDNYLPPILSIDPEAQIEVKEKFGALRIWVGSETIDDWGVFSPFIEAAEEASQKVCQICGAPGHCRPNKRWIQTLCDQCFEMEPKDRFLLTNALAKKLKKKENR